MSETVPPASPPEGQPFQFHLKHLLGLTALVAVVCAALASVGVGITLAIVTILVPLAVFLVWRSLSEASVVFVILAMLTALIIPTDSQGISPGRRAICTNHLKQIALALHNYHDHYGCFPPAYIADENGKPMHSWRVLLLPYLEEEDLYKAYDFNEPWDGPNNRKLLDRCPTIFRCPSERNGRERPSSETSYLAVIGPHTMWPGQQCVKFDDVPDGFSHTIMVVEAADSGIHWLEPRDLHVLQMNPAVNPEHGQGISSKHTGRANVALVDGAVWILPDTATTENIKALLTRDGGEKVDWQQLQ